MTQTRARFLEAPDPARLFEWLDGSPGGAIHMVVTRARPPGLVATPSQPPGTLEERVAEIDGVHRAVLIHAQGRIEEGEPVAVAGVTADHRAEAFEAVDQLLELLSGVAEREDLPA